MAVARSWALRPKAIWRWRIERWRRFWLAIVGDTNPAAPGRAGEVGPQAVTREASFEAFFRQHEQDIFAYLWRMTGEEQAAYDLSQETFVRAWQHYSRISGYDRPRAWLFRVATNLALNYLRDRGSHPDVVIEHELEEGLAGSDPAWHVVERDQVRETLLALSAKQRAALVLREVHGLTCEEVAHALGISRDAAKMLVCRAREQFRQRYTREEGRP
jgi:RNA polymerase sigma-70 factor, ECF subfamily